METCLEGIHHSWSAIPERDYEIRSMSTAECMVYLLSLTCKLNRDFSVENKFL